MEKKINIVWFKKDLRLIDHLPLFFATEESLPCLLLFCFEPKIKASPSWNIRHWQFMFQSLQIMNNELAKWNHKIYIFYENATSVFQKLSTIYEIKTIFSHQETGIAETYETDKYLASFFKNQGIEWREFQTNGIIRSLKNRDNWEVLWKQVMQKPIYGINFSKLKTIKLSKQNKIAFNQNFDLLHEIKLLPKQFQQAGTKTGYLYLNSFLKKRVKLYMQHVSIAQKSRSSCSRISPYLTYGNLSMRMVYQQKEIFKNDVPFKRNINAFASRLYWHCHFIQKFEMQEKMQFQNLNAAFNKVRTEINHNFLNAWKNGKTGYPLVDASMRCVKNTGYINFRSRAMLVSFLCHHLWQPWQAGADFLAQQFLDFEPGIHYPQFQMQASTTGINTIRVYNPEKQALTKDSDAIFIKKWLPELTKLPDQYALLPYKMTSLEEGFYNFKLGKDYPKPIVPLSSAKKGNLKLLWEIKRSTFAKKNNKEILARHVSKNRKRT